MTRTIESIEGLMQRIAQEDARKYDVIADTRRMNVEVTHPAPRDLGDTGAHEVIRDPDKVDVSQITTTLVLDNGPSLDEFRLSDHTLGQMATDVGIPKRYFDRMKVEAPGLFVENVHHWLREQPQARLIRGLRNPDGPMIGRAWLSDRFRRLDNIEVARRLLPEFENLGMPVEFHQAAITESKLHVRALFPDLERDVKKVGDTVRYGVAITNSEIGAGSLTLSAFVLRLACINGLVLDKVLNVRHVGKREGEGILSNEALAADDRAFWLAARDELRALCTEAAFETIVARLDGLSERQVVSPVAATKVLANEFSLTEAEEEAVMLAFVADPTQAGRSQWGMLNAITAAAQASDSFDRQAELESLGWQVAQMPEAEWAKVALAVR